MDTNVAEYEDVFAESNGIQENQKLQDKGAAKSILPRTKDEYHLWLSQILHGRKTSSIMTMLEQVVETRS